MDRRSPLLLVAVACTVLAACTPPAPVATPHVAAASTAAGTPSRAAPAASGAPTQADPQRLTVTLSGDLLWHDGLLRDAAAAGGAKGADYDFEPLFQHVRPLIADADVSLCHVEVPVAPPGVRPGGYPVFAAPRETIEAAAAVGFDYCTFASNHTFDQGTRGVEATLDALDASGIVHTGAYRAEAASTEPSILTTASGVKVAVVAGSYGSNSAVPQGRAWALDRLDTADLIARGRAARAAGADLVFASMHAGTEHQTRPNNQQLTVATTLAESGVFDLVYGHHAHVPQPWDRIDGVWVVYGGGNLVGQMKVATPRAYEEYLGRLTFARRDGRWTAVDAEYVPLLMTLSRPGAPARVLDVNKALAEGTGDADRLRTARQKVAQAVNLLGVEGVTERGG